MSQMRTSPGVLDVTFIHRRPRPLGHSIEGVFEQVRSALPPDIRPRVWACPFESRRAIRRIGNMAAAALQQSEITHITGDVHYLALAMRASRTVLTIHDTGILHRYGGVRHAVHRHLWFRAPMARSTVVTTVSDFVRDELMRLFGYPADRLLRIYNPIAAHLRYVPKPFDADYPRILMIGSAPNKNQVRQAEALGGLRCHVDFIGKLSIAHRAALERSGVTFNVSADLRPHEIFERYVACDFVMFASTYEGFGMPIIEANAVGRPVITSAAASMPEVAGGAACLVDPIDVASIRTGVIRLLRDAVYRRELVSRGLENASRFAATSIASEYAQVYRSTAGD